MIALAAIALAACGGEAATAPAPEPAPAPPTQPEPATSVAQPSEPDPPRAPTAIVMPASGHESDSAAESAAEPAAAPAIGPIPSGAIPAAAEEEREPAIVGPPTVVLDPGHGGADSGAAANGVVERDSNLDLALRVEAILQVQGLRVILTRRDGGRAAPTSPTDDEEEEGFRRNRRDLQARVDLANAESADLFVSLHSNGHPSAEESGVEVWYDPNRPFSEQNVALAEALLSRIVGELNASGFPTRSRGTLNDECWRSFGGRCRPLFVLGPARTLDRERLIQFGVDPARFGFGPGEEVIVSRATQMPAALVEALFLSNPEDAAVLRDAAGRQAIARGIAQGILAFLAEEQPGP